MVINFRDRVPVRRLSEIYREKLISEDSLEIFKHIVRTILSMVFLPSSLATTRQRTLALLSFSSLGFVLIGANRSTFI